VKPNYNDDSCVRVHVTQVELLPSLKALALGTATSVHQWDESSQSFILAAGKDKAPARIVIDGIDEISGDRLLTFEASWSAAEVAFIVSSSSSWNSGTR
jgi:hypothetical protein